MLTTGLVVVVIVGGSGCFSTARYDAAHLQRVASINARYAAEGQRVDEQYAFSVAALDERADLIPMTPGSGAPVSRIDEREEMVLCCLPAYLDTLLKTYVRADVTWVASQRSVSNDAEGDAEREARMARSHNQEVRRALDAQIRALAQQRAEAQGRLARERQHQIQASEQQRTSEIASGRAVRRARLQAAADASTPMGQGSISARQHGVAAIDDQLLSRVGGCSTGVWLPGRAASSHSSKSPGAGQPAARR